MPGEFAFIWNKKSSVLERQMWERHSIIGVPQSQIPYPLLLIISHFIVEEDRMLKERNICSQVYWILGCQSLNGICRSPGISVHLQTTVIQSPRGKGCFRMWLLHHYSLWSSSQNSALPRLHSQIFPNLEQPRFSRDFMFSYYKLLQFLKLERVIEIY